MEAETWPYGVMSRVGQPQQHAQLCWTAEAASLYVQSCVSHDCHPRVLVICDRCGVRRSRTVEMLILPLCCPRRQSAVQSCSCVSLHRHSCQVRRLSTQACLPERDTVYHSRCYDIVRVQLYAGVPAIISHIVCFRTFRGETPCFPRGCILPSVSLSFS